eukprot:3100135-Rhodomonas_salina.1
MVWGPGRFGIAFLATTKRTTPKHTQAPGDEGPENDSDKPSTLQSLISPIQKLTGSDSDAIQTQLAGRERGLVRASEAGNWEERCGLYRDFLWNIA